MAILYNIADEPTRRRCIEEAMEKVSLTALRNRPVGTLSGGMKQRVALAQSFLHTPRLLIVDEPTAGLDPEERIRVRSLLAEMGSERVIILSTHLIEDVEAVADRVAVLHRGQIRFEGTIREMMDTVRGKVWQIEMTPAELTAIRGRYLETGLLRDGGRVHLRVVADQVEEPDVRPAEPTLEDAYICLMREGNQDAA
jgi:ABC-2 type transport system ATP-binding protein